MKFLLSLSGWLLLAVVPVSAQEAGRGPDNGLHLRVQSIQGQKAVIQDWDTSLSHTVQVGDQIKGWIVVSITGTVVTIEKISHEGRAVRAQLAVPFPVPPVTP